VTVHHRGSTTVIASFHAAGRTIGKGLGQAKRRQSRLLLAGL
jgi:hypothetical protein